MYIFGQIERSPSSGFFFFSFSCNFLVHFIHHSGIYQCGDISSLKEETMTMTISYRKALIEVTDDGVVLQNGKVLRQ